MMRTMKITDPRVIMLVFAATAVAMGISCSSDSDFERSVSGAVEATLTAVADGNQPIPGPIPRPLPTTVIDDRSSAPTIFSLPPTATPLPDPRVTAFTSFNHFYQLTGIGNRYNRFTDAVYDQYRFSYELESRLEGKETSKAGFEMLVGQYPPPLSRIGKAHFGARYGNYLRRLIGRSDSMRLSNQ